jgi:hypothetical protein
MPFPVGYVVLEFSMHTKLEKLSFLAIVENPKTLLEKVRNDIDVPYAG